MDRGLAFVIVMAAICRIHGANDVLLARARVSSARLSPAQLESFPLPLHRYITALQRNNTLSQDCQAYALAYEWALRLLPSRAPLQDVFDGKAAVVFELCKPFLTFSSPFVISSFVSGLSRLTHSTCIHFESI